MGFEIRVPPYSRVLLLSILSINNSQAVESHWLSLFINEILNLFLVWLLEIVTGTMTPVPYILDDVF